MTNMTLREEVEYLRERVAQLEALLFEPITRRPFGLTNTENRMFQYLKRRMPGAVSKDALMTVLYDGRDEPAPKIVDVFACKIRKKLAGNGYHIQTIWGVGYALAEGEDDAERVEVRQRVRAPNWSPAEDRMLRESFSIDEAVEKTGRTRVAVWARSQRLGHRWGRRRKLAA